MGSIDQEPQPERILKTDLREYSNRTRHDGPYADDLDLDVLIVGAGELLVLPVSQSSFDCCTPRHAGERPVRSLILDSEEAFDRSTTNISKDSAALSVCTR